MLTQRADCSWLWRPGMAKSHLSLYLEDPSQPLSLAVNLGKRGPCWKD